MSNVSLRVYNREIETMIEGGRLDEAVAHCQHILKTFPMYIETYRLLGKSFLEARRYTDAADIFQRTLMAVPDDFVAHVGMSIIRDDEGQLDDAIWHMERAFEDQPSNTAIQTELRRLYGRRDGFEPPKIRLSRDALANMYAQGGLFNQAIAEIRSVLAEDPNRPDLQVMLARAYFRAGQKVEAAEMAANLLKKYNYCVDALRILVDVLPEASKTENTQVYRQRLHMLDPYSSFVAGSVFSTDQVPDVSVNLERLEYVASTAPASPQPNWASTLGIKLAEEKRNESTPEWMASKGPSKEPIEKPTEKLPIKEEKAEPEKSVGEPAPTSGDKSVPEWMRSAGWKESTGNVPEAAVEPEIQKPAEPLEKADIPEWLKAMAPEGISEASPVSEQVPTQPAPSSEGDIPEWLKGLGTVSDVGANPELQPSTAAPLETNAFPDWLKEMEPTPATEPRETLAEENLEQPPSQELSPAQPTPSQTVFDEQSRPESTTAPLGVEEMPFQSTGEAKPMKIEDDAMAWLESLGAKQDAKKDEELPTKPDEGTEDMPDWLRSGGVKPAASIPTKPLTPASEMFPAEQPSSDQDYFDLKEPYKPEVPPVEPAEEPSQSFNFPFEPSTPIEGVPQFGENPKLEDFQPETTSHIDFNTPATPTEEPAQSLINEEDSNAWLKNLMGEQNFQQEDQPAVEITSKEFPVEPPLEETSQPPSPRIEIEDLRDESATGQSYQPEETPSPAVIPSEELPPENLPGANYQPFPLGDETGEWLGGTVDRQNVSPEENQPAEGIPSEAPQPEKPNEEIPQIASLDVDADAWLENPQMTAQKTPEEEKSPDSMQQVESQPEWLQTPTQEPTPEEKTPTPEGPSATPEEDITITSWLNKHDVEAALGKARSISQVTPTKEKPKEELPDWLKEPVQPVATEKRPEQPSTPVSVQTTKEKVPDWLGQATQPEGKEAEVTPVSEVSPEHEIPTWVDSRTPVIKPPAPTTPGEWTTAEETPIPVPDISPAPIPAAVPPEPPLQRQILGGTGMLSRIPPEDKDAEFLSAAQTALDAKEIKKSMQEYAKLIKKNRLLDEVIHDLREAIYRFPVDISIWQTLGDASMRANRLQDALDAYTKAEELLR